MDGIDFLRSEHDKIRAKFKAIYQRQESAARRRKFNDLVRFLKVHEGMEQKAWYPYLSVPHKFIQHFIHDEAQAATLLKSFSSVDYESKKWWAMFDKLHRDVAHHAADEEGNLFPAVALSMSKRELVALKSRMKAYKQNQYRRNKE